MTISFKTYCSGYHAIHKFSVYDQLHDTIRPVLLAVIILMYTAATLKSMMTLLAEVRELDLPNFKRRFFSRLLNTVSCPLNILLCL